MTPLQLYRMARTCAELALIDHNKSRSKPDKYAAEMLLEYGVGLNDVLTVSGVRNKNTLLYEHTKWPEDHWWVMADVRDRFYEQLGEDEQPKIQERDAPWGRNASPGNKGGYPWARGKEPITSKLLGWWEDPGTPIADIIRAACTAARLDPTDEGNRRRVRRSLVSAFGKRSV